MPPSDHYLYTKFVRKQTVTIHIYMVYKIGNIGSIMYIKSFIICTHHQILLGISNQGEQSGQGMWHAWERGETCTGFWSESPKEREQLKDQGVDGRMGSKWTLGRLARACGVDSADSG
jgi:hypothetical protein